MTAILDRLRPAGAHRAVDRAEALAAKVRALETELRHGADALREATAVADRLRVRAIEAETVATCFHRDLDDVTAERDQLLAEVLPLRARVATVDAVTVPAAGAPPRLAFEDQVTQPIPVLPLWQAYGIGPTIRVADAPEPADPRTPTWVPGSDSETTQSLRIRAA
ncbi:hypothetical protein ACWCWD_06570 [Streptomyces sp. NPDC001493]